MTNTKIYDILHIVILISILMMAILIILHSCDEHPNITSIKKSLEENKKSIDSLNKEIFNIRVSVTNSLKQIDSLNRKNENIIKKVGYEISQLDELFKNSSDTLLVNAIIRYYTDRFYNEIPEFFQRTAPNF